MQNEYVERIDCFLREDILDAYWFEDLEQLRILADKWKQDYNYNYPHKSLSGLAPCTYAPWNDIEKNKTDFVNLYPV